MPFNLNQYANAGLPELYTPQQSVAPYAGRLYGEAWQSPDGDYGPPVSGRGEPGYHEALGNWDQAKQLWKREATKSVLGLGGDMGKANAALGGAAKSLAGSL